MSTVTVTNLGKAYKQYTSRWSRLAEWLDPRDKRYHQLHWVLQDINFRVEPGEAVGIMGGNGAGKSTLLKMITGTTQPTTGSVSISGRVAALLELGMGFHPDFTGRQNVYMAGQLLGYSMKDIDALMPEIEEFSEIGEYIDQPVRMYSSGMQMRLAFSVATAQRPDVLIVDEALSVGDSYFQHKSFDRIRNFREKGTTLLLVSHDQQSIQSICDKAVLIAEGKILIEADPEIVMSYYNASLAGMKKENIRKTSCADGKSRVDSGTFEAEIQNVELFNVNEQAVDIVDVGEHVTAKVEVKVNKNIESLVLGFGVKDRLGQLIFGTNTFNTNQVVSSPSSGDMIHYKVSFTANLGVGEYSIHCSLVKSDSHIEKNYHWVDRAKLFSVVNIDKPAFAGCSWNKMNFNIEKLQ